MTTEAAKEHFTNYTEYAKTLRTWLVAYGIGAPVLFVTNPTVAKQVKESGFGSYIVYLFMAGVALQIMIALINKWAAWHMYFGEENSEYKAGSGYKKWEWVNSQTRLDLALDALSIAAFVVATVWVLRVLLA
ncbi:hypothetical protein [Lysobacter capsici]|uniref:hypothetical protein n=1 Tax=Lysobacter capsici TaxID=435897 RepID=UPI00287BA189|nr:hypothetical protein [Lysobacter capsici]WND80552.1 hypothetical protein RJ610_25290 [Lysobacter capsici]WND85748.1 hypothetical protein RJ609_25310 [Lysobacter capsici]